MTRDGLSEARPFPDEPLPGGDTWVQVPVEPGDSVADPSRLPGLAWRLMVDDDPCVLRTLAAVSCFEDETLANVAYALLRLLAGLDHEKRSWSVSTWDGLVEPLLQSSTAHGWRLLLPCGVLEPSDLCQRDWDAASLIISMVRLVDEDRELLRALVRPLYGMQSAMADEPRSTVPGLYRCEGVGVVRLGDRGEWTLVWDERSDAWPADAPRFPGVLLAGRHMERIDLGLYGRN